jgi:hypothetical protein
LAHARATGEIEAPAKAVYDLLADFGDVGWMRGVTRVEVEGEGVGMRRSIFAGGDEAVVEELESLDAGARRVSYTIPHNNPLPVADYHATCTAVDLGGGRSRLDWEADFTPVGVDQDAAVARVEAMYGVLIGWVKSALEDG